MKLLRFIKQTFWLDVVILLLVLLLTACDVVQNPTVYERNNVLTTRGKDVEVRR